MNQKGITLYCKKEKWAVYFKDKEEILKNYSFDLIYNVIGKQYKELFSDKIPYYNVQREMMDYKIIKQEFTCNYIMRDFWGDPITAKDFERKYKTQKILPIYKGFPVPYVHKKKRSKRVGHKKNNFKNLLNDVFMIEKETEQGVLIPPVRVKRTTQIKQRMFFLEDYPLRKIKEKNWKNYRKKQWK